MGLRLDTVLSLEYDSISGEFVVESQVMGECVVGLNGTALELAEDVMSIEAVDVSDRDRVIALIGRTGSESVEDLASDGLEIIWRLMELVQTLQDREGVKLVIGLVGRLSRR